MSSNNTNINYNSNMSSSTAAEPRILSSSISSASISSETSAKAYEVITFDTFDTMGLQEDILRGIYSYGFSTPSKIQRVAIKPMIDNHDILAQSQSGTGKTPTFVIGSMSAVEPTLQSPQVLVLSHTRELANQTADVAKGIGQYLKVSEKETGIKVMTATGGTPVNEDMKALRRGAQFIVGTPGRIFDLIKRGMNLSHLKWLVLDEADQLFEDLFADQIREILGTGAFPSSTKLAMFSATMPVDVLDIAERFLKDPVRILLPPEEVRLEGIKQYHVDCEQAEWKYDVLADLYKHMTINQAIIFVNKKATAESLTHRMGKDGYTLEYIHGEMEPAERRKRMDDFRKSKVRILIATDVLARGIDVQTVSTVINYEMPQSRENYFHRIGRCGRFGRKGLSINLIAGAEEFAMMNDIEKHYSISIPHLPEDMSIMTSASV